MSTVKIRITNLYPEGLKDHFTIGEVYEVDEQDFYPRTGDVVINSKKVPLFGPICILKSEFEVVEDNV